MCVRGPKQLHQRGSPCGCHCGLQSEELWTPQLCIWCRNELMHDASNAWYCIINQFWTCCMLLGKVGRTWSLPLPLLTILYSPLPWSIWLQSTNISIWASTTWIGQVCFYPSLCIYSPGCKQLCQAWQHLLCCTETCWGGMCRCDPGTQCWVNRVNVEAAHFGARVLKRKPPGEGAMPKRRESCFFRGVNMDEICWNCYGRIWPPWPTISTDIYSPGPPVLWVNMQKPSVWVERLLHSVEQQKGSDRVTLWQVNKTNPQIVPSSSEMGQPRLLSFSNLIRLSSSKRRQSRLWSLGDLIISSRSEGRQWRRLSLAVAREDSLDCRAWQTWSDPAVAREDSGDHPQQ